MKHYNFKNDEKFAKMPFLTPLEKKIIKMANEGKVQKEIAFELGQSFATTKRRFARIQKIYEIYNFFNKKMEKIREILDF